MAALISPAARVLGARDGRLPRTSVHFYAAHLAPSEEASQACRAARTQDVSLGVPPPPLSSSPCSCVLSAHSKPARVLSGFALLTLSIPRGLCEAGAMSSHCYLRSEVYRVQASPAGTGPSTATQE